MKKEDRHAAIRRRAVAALYGLYGNATIHAPDLKGPSPDLPSGEHWTYWKFARKELEAEVDGINNCEPYGDHREMLEFFISTHRSRATGLMAYDYYCRGRQEATAGGQRHLRTSNYGQVLLFGNGQETAVPDHLTRSLDGRIAIDLRPAQDLSIGPLVDLILTLEALNKALRDWCSKENQTFMWEEAKGDLLPALDYDTLQFLDLTID